MGKWDSVLQVLLNTEEILDQQGVLRILKTPLAIFACVYESEKF